MRSRIVATLAVTASLAALLSCAARVEPEERGMVTVAGVQVSVQADSWEGWPAPLTEVIPLLVTVQNRGSVPVRLRYQEFQLVPPRGAVRMALPPFDITGTETTAVGTVGTVAAPYPYGIDAFYVSPYMARFYPHLRRFHGPFLYDPWFYSTYYPIFLDIPLPSRDMVAKALPEGVLEPGGTITGFLYFQGDDPAGDVATLRMDVVDANDGRTLGTIRVPLEID